MIIIGYQGIGKTTLCMNKGTAFRFIDLESSSFRDDDGNRPDNWYVYYCNIAEQLSRQDNIVFISSHKEVRDRLKNSDQDVVCVFPSLKIKDEWIKRLESRYQISKSDKDYRAWQNALEKYDENIKDLMECGINYIEIESIDYKLQNLVIDYEIKLLSGSLSISELLEEK